MTECFDRWPQVVHVGVSFGRATVADRHDRDLDRADLRRGDLAVQIRAELDVGIAHAGVDRPLRRAARATGGVRGGAVAFLREPGSSSDLAAEPGE